MDQTYKLSVDWDNNDNFTGLYDDITGDLFTVKTVRGRDYNSMLVGRAKAGTLTAKLYNKNAKYSRYNASSPIYGNILPGRRVRLESVTPTPAVLWDGYLTNISASAPIGDVPSAELQAIGSLSRLKRDITTTTYRGKQVSTLLSELISYTGFPFTRTNIEATNLSWLVAWWYAIEEDALEAARKLEDTDLGFLFEANDGVITYHKKSHRYLASRSVNQQAYFTDVDPTALSYTDIAVDDSLQYIFNDVNVSVKKFTEDLFASILWSYDVGVAGLSLQAGETKTFTATYDKPVSSWTNPTINVDVVGANAALLAVENVVKNAGSMTFDLRNTTTGTLVTLSALRARGKSISVSEPLNVNGKDATSQTVYGKQSFEFPSNWITQENQAQDYANAIIYLHKDPIPIVTIRFPAHKNLAHFNAAVGLELSDRVRIEAELSANQNIDKPFYVESITHEIDQYGLPHFVELVLSPVDTAGFWILGTSQLGTDTRLGY